MPIHCLNYVLDFFFVCEFSHFYPGVRCLWMFHRQRARFWLKVPKCSGEGAKLLRHRGESEHSNK